MDSVHSHILLAAKQLLFLPREMRCCWSRHLRVLKPQANIGSAKVHWNLQCVLKSGGANIPISYPLLHWVGNIWEKYSKLSRGKSHRVEWDLLPSRCAAPTLTRTTSQSCHPSWHQNIASLFAVLLAEVTLFWKENHSSCHLFFTQSRFLRWFFEFWETQNGCLLCHSPGTTVVVGCKWICTENHTPLLSGPTVPLSTVLFSERCNVKYPSKEKTDWIRHVKNIKSQCSVPHNPIFKLEV